MFKKRNKKKKLTLILAGGGVKSLSYLGFIDAISEDGLEIDMIGCYSGGTWIAAAIGMGKKYDEIKKILEQPWWKLVDLNILRERSFLSNNKIDKVLDDLVGNIKFEDLKYKTVIFATDITNKKLAWFDEGEVKKYIRASMALAPILSGVVIDDVEYIDGVFITAFPTSIMREYAPDNLIVGLMPKLNFQELPDFFFKRARYIELMYTKLKEYMIKEDPPDIFIETLAKDKGDILTYKLIDYFYEEGFKAGKRWSDVLKEKLGN